MGDAGGTRKRKRHGSPLENNKTVKAVFKKDDLDDSMSVSDWGLVIEDNPRSRSRGRFVKLNDEELTMVCEWDACCDNFNDYAKFGEHLHDHMGGYIDRESDGGYHCQWLSCTFKTQSYGILAQHLCYHGYVTKLKSIGRNVEARNDLPECTQKENRPEDFPLLPDGYECEWEYCHETFMVFDEFVAHMAFHVFHTIGDRTTGLMHCAWKGCTNGAFKNHYKLTEHMRIHSKEKLLACSTCGSLFSNRTKFCDHRRRQIPLNKQSYMCSQCSKYFASERLLKDHMRLHINHYKCSMCEMTCPKPSVLAKHIRFRHVKVKPFKCSQCDYQLEIYKVKAKNAKLKGEHGGTWHHTGGVAKHNLDVHMKTHQTKKEFTCDQCDYSCRSAFALDKHTQKSHGSGFNNIYECHSCKKKFPRGGVLTKHLMKVHNYHWPSGHSRFRYKEDPDGYFRLQTVRYETLDVTEEIIKGKNTKSVDKKEPTEFVVRKHIADYTDSIQKYDVVPANEEQEGKQVMITIADVDTKGNVLKFETIESNEIIEPSRIE